MLARPTPGSRRAAETAAAARARLMGRRARTSASHRAVAVRRASCAEPIATAAVPQARPRAARVLTSTARSRIRAIRSDAATTATCARPPETSAGSRRTRATRPIVAAPAPCKRTRGYASRIFSESRAARSLASALKRALPKASRARRAPIAAAARAFRTTSMVAHRSCAVPHASRNAAAAQRAPIAARASSAFSRPAARVVRAAPRAARPPTAGRPMAGRRPTVERRATAVRRATPACARSTDNSARCRASAATACRARTGAASSRFRKEVTARYLREEVPRDLGVVTARRTSCCSRRHR